MKRPPPPQSEIELVERARAIAGFSIGEIAARYEQPIPADLRRDKGWIGQLLEWVLGSTAATLAEPDFQSLGIELKTIPIKTDGKPRESTYICTVSLSELLGQSWRTSHVWNKLARVMWMPIIVNGKEDIRERRIGHSILWSPTPEQERILKQDWEELVEMIALGKVQSISARQGIYLQIRPKAADSRVLCDATGEEGDRIKINPRGFYLRASFTTEILKEHYAASFNAGSITRKV